MIKLSNDLFAVLLKTLWFILVTFMLYFIFEGDYFIVLIFSFPVLGWTLGSNIFRAKSISFNRKKILVDSRTFDLLQIEEIESHILKNSYVKIKGKKYYFIAPLKDHDLDSNLEELKKFITLRKNEMIENTTHNKELI